MSVLTRILIETGCILTACLIAFIVVVILDGIECKIKDSKEKIRLKNNRKTKVYLNNLNKVYSIECAAKWAVREYYFSGKYDGVMPLVWKYYDANGLYDEWILTKVDSTGWMFFDWTFQKDKAEEVCRLLNIRDGLGLTDEESRENT